MFTIKIIEPDFFLLVGIATILIIYTGFLYLNKKLTYETIMVFRRIILLLINSVSRMFLQSGLTCAN